LCTSGLQVVCDLTQFCCNAVLKVEPIPDECHLFNMISAWQKFIFGAQIFYFENMVSFIHDTVFPKEKVQHFQFVCGLFTKMLNLVSGVGFNGLFTKMLNLMSGVGFNRVTFLEEIVYR
jgi:hypothetical protein